MCGRAFCVVDEADIIAAAGYAPPLDNQPTTSGPPVRVLWRNRDAYGPVRNAGPTMTLPCITAVPRAGDDEAEADAPPTIAVESMAWGFPRAATGARDGEARGPDGGGGGGGKSPPLLINARSETALLTPTWVRALASPSGRAVLVVQGYYEWRRSPGSSAPPTPHYVSRRDGLPLALAAACREPDASASLSLAGRRRFAVLTTEPPPNLAFLHDRTPLLLPTAGAVRAWLHPRGGRLTAAGLAALERPDLRGWPELVAWPVTREVGKVAYQGADCNIDVRTKKGSIASLFAAKAKAGGGGGGGGGRGGGGAKRVKEEEDKDGAPAATTPAGLASPAPLPVKKAKAEGGGGGGGGGGE